MRRTKTDALTLIAITGGASLALVLSGCAGGGAPAGPAGEPVETEGTASNEQPGGDSGAEADARGVATFSVDGRTFEFQLRVCAVYGDGETLISGLGGEVGSDVPSHLDGDTTSWEYGGFRIDIGADGPFQSSDEFLAIGSHYGDTFSIAEAGSGYFASGDAWDENGTNRGQGSVEFSCD